MNEGGQRVARAAAVGAAGVAWIESPDIVVGTSGFKMTLAHRHRFESDGLHHDGGVVEISTDGGATWAAVAGSPSTYTGVLSDCCGNPLQGREAFVGDSAGYPAYTHTTLDFGSGYNGQVVRLRLGLAEDEAVGSAGWDIDTVTLSGATNLPFASTTWQGQACGAPSSDIEVAPGTLAATLPAGAQSSASFTIGNVGVGHLHWSVAESCTAPADVPWLSLGRTEGTTLTGTSTSVPVMFDAAGLDPGTYSALLCIDSNDRNEPRALKPVTLTVVNGAPSFASTPVTQASVGVPYLYAVVATDPSPADTLTIIAVQTPEWLVLDAVEGTRTASLSGTPGAADAGSHVVVLQVSDGTLSAQQSFSVVVNAAPAFTSTPVTTAVQDSAYSYTVTASDPNAGDTLAFTATVSPDWLDLADSGDGTASLTGTPDLDDLGVHPVVLVVTDAAGLSAQQSFSITVAPGNSAPVAVGSIGAQDNDEGDVVTLDVATAFEDADPGDTLAYSAAGLPPGLSIDAGTGIIGGTLGFDTAGVYSVTITATDSAGASADQQFEWTVNDVVLPAQVFADGFEDN